MISKSGVVVITGASRGLGAVLAKRIVEEGFSAALISRSEDELSKIRDDLLLKIRTDQKITIHKSDLSKKGDVEKCFKEIFSQHTGGISALVNNAGTWTGGLTVSELHEQDLKDSMDLNFYSAFNCIKETLTVWTTKKAPLSIINIGATASKRGGKKSFAFAMAKSSLRILSQSLARELGPDGIHVAHFVIDGLIDNPRTRKLNPQAPDHKYIKMDSLANEVIHVMLQTRDCWTFEWDVRTSTCDW